MDFVCVNGGGGHRLHSLTPHCLQTKKYKNKKKYTNVLFISVAEIFFANPLLSPCLGFDFKSHFCFPVSLNALLQKLTLPVKHEYCNLSRLSWN